MKEARGCVSLAEMTRYSCIDKSPPGCAEYQSSEKTTAWGSAALLFFYTTSAQTPRKGQSLIFERNFLHCSRHSSNLAPLE